MKTIKSSHLFVIILALLFIFPSAVLADVNNSPIKNTNEDQIPLFIIETGKKMGDFEGSLTTFFTGSIEPSSELPNCATRCIQTSGRYIPIRSPKGFLNTIPLETSVQTNPDRSIRAFGTRWIEIAPYLYQDIDKKEILSFHTNSNGEITYLTRNGTTAYKKLSLFETSLFKGTVLLVGIIGILLGIRYLFRHPIGKSRPSLPK